MNSTALTADNQIDSFIEFLREKAKENPLVLEMASALLDLTSKLDRQEEAEFAKQCEAHKGKYAEIIELIKSHPKY